MTEPLPPGDPGADTPLRPDAELRALAFADVDTAKRWARGLPVQNVGLVCETVLGQLKSLAAATFAPRERVSHVVFDHTSILRMIEWRWGLEPMSRRDRTAKNLAERLDFSIRRPPVTLPDFTPPDPVACPPGSAF